MMTKQIAGGKGPKLTNNTSRYHTLNIVHAEGCAKKVAGNVNALPKGSRDAKGSGRPDNRIVDRCR